MSDRRLSLVSTRLDPFRKIRSRSDMPKAELRLDAWSMQQIHKELKMVRKASSAALTRARESVREAETASTRSYLVLSSFEAEMKALFESQGWVDFSEFETLEGDGGGDNA